MYLTLHRAKLPYARPGNCTVARRVNSLHDRGAWGRGVEDSPMPSEHPRAILIVDDDEAVLETAVTLVESLGYRAKAASNASEALAWLIHDGSDFGLAGVA